MLNTLLVALAIAGTAPAPPNMMITLSRTGLDYSIAVTSGERQKLPVTITLTAPGGLKYVTGKPQALVAGSTFLWNGTLPANGTLKVAFTGAEEEPLEGATVACVSRQGEDLPVVCASLL
ncbi:hypothetical protein ACIBG8_45000 [Nonomuraea sp. NPDC050556]|uniref:hypothetical protein n=1 Tax=Nonomuraea sp. NPDC050556 TaxID=3364369 RepID=UPI0037ACF915